MSDSTRQDGNIVYGNQAGRDVTINNVNQDVASRPSTMKTLAAKYQAEVGASKDFQGFIDSLQYYLDPFAPEDQLDLEAKLTAGDRAQEYHGARTLKENFAKKLARYQLSVTGQEIFSFILGQLHSLFIARVRPLIESGASKIDVDTAIVTEVIGPTIETLDSNPLIINHQELRGMLYYLTGNCHLRWDSRD